ncbi:MAG: phosphate signaling complex protein PhoU [Finegoldia sp.]|nr:phosphate signaling complex protein PhoU [Finegoldia sp.]
MRKYFTKQLDDLKHDLILYGANVERQVEQAIYALETNDLEVAKEIIDDRYVVNQMYKAIEDTCLRLLTTQAPVAKDMRFISSSLKIIDDMQKMADHAVEIAEIALNLQDANIPELVEPIRKLYKRAQKMIVRSIDAFTESDIDLANKVIESDDKVDSLYEEIVEDAIELIKEGSDNPAQIIDIIQIVKYIERISDKAVSVCEWVIYAVTGERAEEQDNILRNDD